MAASQRARIAFDEWPAAIYAIGDVHGCIDQLLSLEGDIIADAAGFPGEKWIVTLGDYIDRGPASAQVVEHLLAPPPPGLRRICLLGNHEQMLLDFLQNPAANINWLEWGGLATLQSYGAGIFAGEDWRRLPRRSAERLAAHLPAHHLALLQTLPICLSAPGFFFVHAGIRPGVPVDRQEDFDLLWIRAAFLNAAPRADLTVVHGHTPVEEPMIAPGRIDIDTGCFHSGVLTALRVTPDRGLKLLQAFGQPSDYTPPR